MGSHHTVLEDAPMEDSWRLQAKGQQICYSATEWQICRNGWERDGETRPPTFIYEER